MTSTRRSAGRAGRSRRRSAWPSSPNHSEERGRVRELTARLGQRLALFARRRSTARSSCSWPSSRSGPAAQDERALAAVRRRQPVRCLAAAISRGGCPPRAHAGRGPDRARSRDPRTRTSRRVGVDRLAGHVRPVADQRPIARPARNPGRSAVAYDVSSGSGSGPARAAPREGAGEITNHRSSFWRSPMSRSHLDQAPVESAAGPVGERRGASGRRCRAPAPR